jgi:cellulose synthase/poly-beta-1,6-N-acetylglucosamine synthase-like glycosyltransferase
MYLLQVTFLVFVACIVFLYAIQIIQYAIGWMNVTAIIPRSPTHKIAVIIAVRNEEAMIENCLKALLDQNYPSQLFDVILVDDFSEDGTVDCVKRISKTHSNVFILKLDVADGTGKKAAIRKGILYTDATIIVTTDADCWMEKDWLTTIAAGFENDSTKMVVAPVAFCNEKNVFEKMQSLEFMALIASTAGAIFYKKPIMCNGANLAYLRTSFFEVNGFDGVNHISTGDDVLLMYKLSKIYPNGIRFLKDSKAIVYTHPKNNLMGFINQRKRWASKPFSLLNRATKYTSVLVFLTNLSSIMLIISLFCLGKIDISHGFALICLILLGIKCIIDFLLLFLASSFFGKRSLLIYFLPEQIIYMFYVVFIGLLSTTKSFSWKGRELKN